MERKLTAIMFTDIVGYSRIMSNDEEKGLRLLNYQNEILLKIVGTHNGNILKKMGDALFVDFSSSINAIECAIALQNNLKEYNHKLSQDEQFLLRIGLHIGDVVIHGDDLFGEGINVAARLEPLAEPGGICMSQAFYDSVKVKSDFSAIRIGEVDLKNILEKYTLYKIPSFYVDNVIDSGLESTDGQFQMKYEIESIKKLPPPSRSIMDMSIIIISGYSLFLVITVFIMTSLIKTDRLRTEDLKNPGKILNELKNPTNNFTKHVKGLFNEDAKKHIESYNLSNSVNDTIKNIMRTELNRIIELGKINHNSEIIITLDIPKDIRSNLFDLHEKGSFSTETRLILGQIFYGSISKKPLNKFDMFMEIFPSIFRDLSSSIINVIAIISGIYFMSFSSIKITFRDIRDVDKILIHFVDQMGYKNPYMEKGQMIFKPSLFQIIMWSSSSIKARIDGNSIYLIGNIPIIRKLEKMFQSHEI